MAVVFIQIPALAERKSDLNLLTAHFLDKKNRQLSKNVAGIAMDVLEHFNSYWWPGNVRELEHVIEGAMNLVGTENIIAMRHLSIPFETKTQIASNDKTHKVSTSRNNQIKIFYPSFSERVNAHGKTLAEKKRAYEIDALVSALQETQGNASRAARNLGISPQSMNYRLRRYNINKKDFI